MLRKLYPFFQAGPRLSMGRLGFECLEARLAMTAEGSVVTLDTVLDTSGLLGSISAQANWGDGNQTTLAVSEASPTGSLRVRLDYSYDSRGFFASQARRDVLQAVADSLVLRFSDTLEAIAPAGTNTWSAIIVNPSTGASEVIANPTIAANEIVIYVGSRDFPGPELGQGGPGGASSRGNAAWLQTVRTRGQSGASASPATDFGPWGGYVAFDDQVSWHFGLDTIGLDSNEHDFVTVATHELIHLLGVGTSGSWNRYVAGGVFTGPQSMAQYDPGGAVPLSGDQAHWQDGVADGGQESLMDPSISIGTRKLATRLDLAGLGDVGWQIINPSARVIGTNIYGDDGIFPISITLRGSQLGTRVIGTSTSITNVAPTLIDRPDLTIGLGAAISIVDLGVFTDPGFDLPLATPARSERFTYRIDWGDGTAAEIGNATIDRVGGPNVTTRGSFDGSHTYQQVGIFTVRFTVVDDEGGSSTQDFVVNVQSPPEFAISIDRTNFVENEGAGVATLRLRRVNQDNSQSVLVQLTSSDTSEVVLPSLVTIPASAAEITIPVQIVDDNLLDGRQLVTVFATGLGVNSNAILLEVQDHETLAMSLTLNRIFENAGRGASVLTITRSNIDNQSPLDVQVISSDPTEAIVPSPTVIPAGLGTVTYPVDAIDDDIFDGLQQVILSGQAAGYVGASVSIEVEDFESLVLNIQPRQLSEPSTVPVIGQVILPGPARVGGQVVALSASVDRQLILPSSVTIPEGSTSVAFDILARNDFVVEGPMTVQINASSVGLAPAAVDLAIIDDDQPIWQNPLRPFDVSNDGALTALDALLVINRLNQRNSGELIPGQDPPAPPFVDVNGNGVLEALDALLVINLLNRSGI